MHNRERWLLLNHKNRAFMGHGSKMRSCRIIRMGNDRLQCVMTWRYRLVGVIVGLAIAPLATGHLVREVFYTPPGQKSFVLIAALAVVAGLTWLLLIRGLLFSRAIEMDGNDGSIEFVRRGFLESRELLSMSEVADVIVEKIVRRKDNRGSDTPWNRIECWLLRVVLRDGGSRSLCETTDRSVVEEMRSLLCKRVTAANERDGR